VGVPEELCTVWGPHSIPLFPYLIHIHIQIILQKPLPLPYPGHVLGSIEWFIEDKAFLPLYDLAPTPSPPTLPVASCLSFSVFLCVSLCIAGRTYYSWLFLKQKVSSWTYSYPPPSSYSFFYYWLSYIWIIGETIVGICRRWGGKLDFRVDYDSSIGSNAPCFSSNSDSGRF
jgi:hypothetical protein